MVASLRHFLVVFLVLLQIAAPLVHAHIGRDVGNDGFHWQGFESVRGFADSPSWVAADHQLSDATLIVELGSALKLQHDPDDFTPVFYLYGDYAALTAAIGLRLISYSPQDEPLLTFGQFLSPPSSRAPPR